MVNPIQVLDVPGVAAPRPLRPGATSVTTPFSQVLESQLHSTRELRFSAHALERLDSRHIELNAPELAQIRSAVDQAAGKGARETLLLMNRFALIVSVPNRTVITAVPYDQLEQTVFTNIDSAVVIAEASSVPPQE